MAKTEPRRICMRSCALKFVMNLKSRRILVRLSDILIVKARNGISNLLLSSSKMSSEMSSGEFRPSQTRSTTSSKGEVPSSSLLWISAQSHKAWSSRFSKTLSSRIELMKKRKTQLFEDLLSDKEAVDGCTVDGNTERSI